MAVTKEFWSEVITYLEELGGVTVADTPAYRTLMAAWERTEGGNAKHNPLNTTLKMKGSTDYNSVPVQNYTSRAQGAEATARTLLDPRHKTLLSAIAKGADPYYIAVETTRAVGDERAWGTDGWLFCQVLHDMSYGK